MLFKLRSEDIPILTSIKTITKFSNVIGYQQPDLSINWTVAHVMLVIWTVRAILRALLRCTLFSKLLGFPAFIAELRRPEGPPSGAP